MTRKERRSVMSQLRMLAKEVMEEFDLPVCKIRDCESELGECGPCTWMGCCDRDGTVHLKLTRPRRCPYSWQTLVDTLMHELAHTKYWDHGRQWSRLFKELIGWYKERIAN